MATNSNWKKGSTNAKQIQKNWSTYKPNKTYKKQLRSAEKGQPTYTNKYKGYEDAVVDNLENRGFEFDTNNPVYQAYAQDYRLLGNIAADQSQANIEDLSGGYGTTYSGDVASQGLEGYLANEKAILPALYQQERANYQQDTANLVNKGNLYNALESADFQQFQDRLAKWNANREYYYNKFYNDYMASAKQHEKMKGKEVSRETEGSTSVRELASGGRRRGSGTNTSKTNNYRRVADYLIDKGYGDKLDDLMTRQEYVKERARKDRDYNAGYTGLSKSDPDYAYKKSVEDKVDVDYSGYLYNYIKNKLKGKK